MTTRARGSGAAFPVALDDDHDGLVVNLSAQPPGEVSSTTLAIAIASGPDLLSAPFASGLEAPVEGALGADLNGDGRRELVVWNPGTIAVHERLPDGTLAPPIELRPATSDEVLAVDVDGDGRSEPLVAITPNRLRALAPIADETSIVDVQLEDMPDEMAARDADGDGALDLVLRDATRVLAYPGMHIDETPQTFTLDSLLNVHALEILDLERDDRPDAFVCHVFGLARYLDRLGPIPGDVEHLDDAPCLQLAATDLDGDGTDELLSISTMLDLLGLGNAVGIALGDGQGFGPLHRQALEHVYANASGDLQRRARRLRRGRSRRCRCLDPATRLRT